jgi:chemotaxis protein MotA
MDIATLAGVLAFLAAMLLGIIGDGSSVIVLWQPQGMVIVLGGTFGIVLLRSTLGEFGTMFVGIGKTFRHKVDKPEDLIDQLVELATIARKDGMIALEGQEINNRMLSKGVSALVDGNDALYIRTALERDMLITASRHDSARGTLQAFGDTAPAMGMIGTLIGLVKLLKNLESNPGGIGDAMSVALLTTFYGALLANGLFLPWAQKLENHAKREERNSELIIEGVIFIQKGGNPRLLGDLLSSFLSPKANLKRQAEAAN